MSNAAEPDIGLLTLVRTLLQEHGPMTAAALAEEFDEDVDVVTDDLYDITDGSISPLLDDRWVDVPSLLAGRVFTHRLTAVEVAHDVLAASPDLELILTADEAGVRLSSGAPIGAVYPGMVESGEREIPDEVRDHGGTIPLPIGALAGMGAVAGDLVGLRVTEAGVDVLRVELDELAEPQPVLDALAVVVEHDRPSYIGHVLLTVCAGAADAFRSPVLPIGDLIAIAGLAHDADHLAPPGFDIAAHEAESRRNALARTYDLSRPEADATMVLLQHAGHRIHRSPGEVAAASAFLAEPAVAEAVRRSTLFGRSGPDELTNLVDDLWPQASRRVRPALQWLRAKAYERRGEVHAAEEALLAAERLGPEWPLTLLDLARYASDRGDAIRGLALLRRAAPYRDAELEELLRRFQPVAGPVVARNDPCWCGSGRKFKQCHLYRPAERTLTERALWLYAKAGRFLQEDQWLSLLDAVYAERTAYAEDDEAFEGSADDPLASDVALFEGGVFAEFVAVRGDLLPADERLLAEQWLLIDRSVFEVTAVRPGEGLTLRDLRTGDVHEVPERLGGSTLRPGHLICARVVPAGDAMQIFGGIEAVRPHERDHLLALLDDDPEPEELVAFLTRRFAPPTLVNTDRDPLVLHSVVLAPGNSSALADALDTAYQRMPDSDPPEWVEERDVDGRSRIDATLRLEADGLHVHANSDRRMAAVLDQIRALDPEVRVVSEERTPLPDLRAAARRLREQPAEPAADLSADDPAVREAMTAYMAEYERKWLDMSVPALHGLTPRQAAADPTRREDLVQLLASMPPTDDPTQMSARRLRAALGLDA